MNNLAPIAVFTYNRPQHTKKILEALDNSPLASQTNMFIFCDNYKNITQIENVNEVREVVNLFAKSNHFKSVQVIKAEVNKGLAKSIIDGVTKIITEYGKIIVMEDDMLASRNFLNYMNGALDYYQNNKDIWSVSGYMFPMAALNHYNHDVFMSGRGCCWGWGTWSDRWQLVDWDVSDYQKFKHNWRKRRSFGKWGRDLPIMLDTQMYSNHNSWAIRWCYAEFKNGMRTVYPSHSYIKNIGNDGTGTHSSNLEEKYDTTLDNSDVFSCNYEMLSYDEGIRKEFSAKYYMGKWKNFKQEIRWILIRTGLLKI